MFKEYKSKPIVRLAYEVKPEDEIITDPSNPLSSVITIDGKPTSFNHHEPVAIGDYIIHNGDTDIYHCNRAVFHDRNEVDDTFETRLLKEHDELMTKTESLHSFISDVPRYSRLPVPQQSLLRTQYHIMCAYRDVLFERIRLLGIDD